MALGHAQGRHRMMALQKQFYWLGMRGDMDLGGRRRVVTARSGNGACELWTGTLTKMLNTLPSPAEQFVFCLLT